MVAERAAGELKSALLTWLAGRRRASGLFVPVVPLASTSPRRPHRSLLGFGALCTTDALRRVTICVCGVWRSLTGHTGLRRLLLTEHIDSGDH